MHEWETKVSDVTTSSGSLSEVAIGDQKTGSSSGQVPELHIDGSKVCDSIWANNYFGKFRDRRVMCVWVCRSGGRGAGGLGRGGLAGGGRLGGVVGGGGN